MVAPARIVTVFSLLFSLSLLAGCESTYFNTMEKFGVHKRDILIDRIEEAQEAQEEGQQQFRSALEQFQAVVAFDGGELESLYNKLNSEYEDSVDAADTIRERIDAVDSVAQALFEEWRRELGEYTNQSLRRDSESKLKATERRYKTLISAMRRAERSLEPVLANLRDNTLYLKHNLNARAIASLKGELGTINRSVSSLLKDMEAAISESERFINTLKQG